VLVGLFDVKGVNHSEFMPTATNINCELYRGADKSLARINSRCILFDGENISFDASLFIYINSTNIPPIMIINRIYKYQNFLLL
jgi:hypothetical protein